jgi:sialic acid synthase SpsE
MRREMNIDGRLVGDGHPTFIIAELGINHNGDPELARRMIDAAARAGADAVKFQTYRTETMIAKGNAYYDIFKQAEISEVSELRDLQEHACKQGVLFYSSATDEAGLDVLIALGRLPLVKLSSANLTNLPLLRRVGALALPVIISTGAAVFSEVMRAHETLTEAGAAGIAVLKCTSIYPCPPEHVNLAGIETLRRVFDGPVGFSDHSVGAVAPIAAVALGASIVEKHFTLDKTMEGHDHHFSADAEELTEMVRSIRAVESMVGSAKIAPVGEEVEFRDVSRRYVTALDEIPAGREIEPHMIVCRRPKDAAGIEPEFRDTVVGHIARRTIPAGHSLKWDDV